MNTKRTIFSLAVLLALAFAQFASPQPVFAATNRYAVPTGGLTSGACDSWADACDLQTAINSASAAAGDQVWVQVGTYYPTVGSGRAATFTLKDGIAVYGGFAYGDDQFSDRSTNPALTVLSGDLGTLGSVGDNAYHVVSITNHSLTTTLLDGFTVTQGNAANIDGVDEFGGGIYITNSSPTLNNLIITENRAGTSVGSGGGGVYIADQNGVPIITPHITNVLFSNNQSGRGGGLFSQNSDPILEYVTFSGNTALATGGGGMNSQTVGTFDPPIDPILRNVVFINNTATGGGGLFIGNSTGELTNVTFSGNVANRRGGGLLLEFSTAVLTNVTFYNNTSNNGFAAPQGGGGLMNIAGSPVLNNVTFSGNTSNANGVDGGAMRNAKHPDFANTSNPVINNSIFWDDISTEITHDNSGTVTITINDSVVEGGCPAFSGVTCNNVINADPLLGALASNGGYTQTMALAAGSSAIDAGNDATCAATDQRGVTRPQGSHCDIGAYELEVLPQTLTVNKLGNGTGTVTSAPGGINCGADCTEDYAYNTLVSLTAIADPGSTFTYWSDLSCLDANPCVVTMNAAKTISAMFRIPAALVSPSGTETAWDKTFEWTGVTGASRYYLEMLKADDTLVHRKWYDAATYCSGLDCTVTVSELGSLPNGGYKWRILDYGPYGPAPFGYGIWSEFTAFTLGAPCYTLSTAINIPGSGTVNTSAQNCTGGYTVGTVVQVSVVPNAGYVFSNWSGDATGSGNPVSVTMTGHKSVTANLREASATLNSPLNSMPNWNGSFDWDGVTGASRYYLEVQKADNTLVHRRWYEAATSCSGLDCVVTPAIGSLPNGGYKWRVLDFGPYGYGSWTAFTNFTLDATCYTLTTGVNIPGSGSVNTSAQNCTGGFTAGTVVQVSVVPNAGYVFTNWGGDATGSSNPVSVTMTGHKSVTANLREASATLISPAGTPPGWNGSFQWSGVTGASRYYLELLTADNTLVHRRWYYADVSCVDLTCVVTPAIGTLPGGGYKWRILDYGSYGYGSWTAFTEFTLP